MDSPRLGFRRAAVTSWALVGAGIAGVTGASLLAYSDTVKPAKAEVSADAAVPAPAEILPSLADAPPLAPVVTTTQTPPSPPLPETTAATVPQYTPRYTPEGTPESTVEQAPPVTNEAPTAQPKAPSTTKRRSQTPTTVMAPNYSPHVTISRGS